MEGDDFVVGKEASKPLAEKDGPQSEPQCPTGEATYARQSKDREQETKVECEDGRADEAASAFGPPRLEREGRDQENAEQDPRANSHVPLYDFRLKRLGDRAVDESPTEVGAESQEQADEHALLEDPVPQVDEACDGKEN